MKNLTAILMGISCSVSLVGWSVSAGAATIVDEELVFILDGSGSIEDSNWNTQINAYYRIFTNPNFYSNYVASLSGKILPNGDEGIGKIAVSVIQFASIIRHEVEWTLIGNQADATAFGNQFLSIAQLGGLTSLGKSIEEATTSITTNNFMGSHLAFDLSSDGVNDPAFGQESDPEEAKDNAIAAGVNVINIIGTPVIEPDTFELIRFGTNIDGSPALLLTGDSIGKYQSLLHQKIAKEIGGVNIPEPSMVLSLLSFGLLGVTTKLLKRDKK